MNQAARRIEPSVEHRGLLPPELELQGTFFVTDFRLRVEDAPSVFRVLPPKMPVFSLVIMTVLISAVMVGFWVTLDRLAPETFTVLWRIFVIIVSVIAVGGALGGHLLRLRYLRGRGALIEFDKRTRELSLDGGRVTCDADDVVCVQSVTNWTRNNAERSLYSELNVIVERNGHRKRHLLKTAMDSRATTFDYILLPLRSATGLRALRVRPEGLLGMRGLIVEEVE
jgi:hypothetical protein